MYFALKILEENQHYILAVIMLNFIGQD